LCEISANQFQINHQSQTPEPEKKAVQRIEDLIERNDCVGLSREKVSISPAGFVLN